MNVLMHERGSACQTAVMLGHLGINVADLEVAKSYYDELLPLLGFEPFLSSAEEFAYKPASGKPGTYLFFYPSGSSPYSRHATGLQHLAFIVAARSCVQAAHDRASALGSEIVHAPRVFPEYPQPYFAAFWLDPFGIMLEAVCHHDRD